MAYATANGSATAGSDYYRQHLGRSPSRCHIADGQRQRLGHRRRIERDVHGGVVQPIGRRSCAERQRAQSQTTIRSQSTPPSASIADLAVVGGNGDHAHFMFTVTLLRLRHTPVTVQYATGDGTATGGTDFVVGSGTLDLRARCHNPETSMSTSRRAWPSRTERSSDVVESIPVTISRGTATATIVDDDNVAVPPTSTSPRSRCARWQFAHRPHRARRRRDAAITTRRRRWWLQAICASSPVTGHTRAGVGTWAFANQPDRTMRSPLRTGPAGVGLYHAMQGAKAELDRRRQSSIPPESLADIETHRWTGITAGRGGMAMVAQYGPTTASAEFLTAHGYETAFINTRQWNPHHRRI